jgi:Xaa-Pro dipeptidase
MGVRQVPNHARQNVPSVSASRIAVDAFREPRLLCPPVARTRLPDGNGGRRASPNPGSSEERQLNRTPSDHAGTLPTAVADHDDDARAERSVALVRGGTGGGAEARGAPVEGGVRLSPREQQRRHELLQGLLDEHDLDALVIAGNDYRGHKGTLRWATDYNLGHRHGFAFVAPGREPELILPQNLALGSAAQGWSTPVRYARRAAQGVVNAIGELAARSRIGIVGLGEILRVADFELLTRSHPHTQFIDATQAFALVRARKSAEELAGVRESTYIAERCFARLLEIVRPGITEREVAAEMYKLTYLLGGEDPLFLSMSAVPQADGSVPPRWNALRDRVLHVGDQFVFSFELIGPMGYWMEFARAVVFGTPNEQQRRLNAACADGMRAAAQRMVPGATPEAVQRGMLDAVERHGARSTYWSGHGLGQDVLEEPWIGHEVVDTEAPVGWELAENMVLAMHPLVTDAHAGGIAYMANSYIVTDAGGEPVSQIPLDIHVV